METRLGQTFEQFGHGHRQPFLDLLHDDGESIQPLPPSIPWAGVNHGRDATLRYLDRIAELLEFEQFELRDFLGSGKRYAILHHERVRVKATGRCLEHDQNFLYRIRDAWIFE